LTQLTERSRREMKIRGGSSGFLKVGGGERNRQYGRGFYVVWWVSVIVILCMDGKDE